MYQLIADGTLPLPDITHYPLTDAATAIRQISGAEHTGKLVLDVPHTGHSSVVVAPEQVPVFRSDSSYIVTGGLGGLGLFLAEKMAEAGCGRIVITSRSQPTVKAQEIVELIRSTGADVVVECGDITAAGTAERLVAAATATGLPVRGVLHAAAVVEDAVLTNITDDLIDRDWAPKVYGAREPAPRDGIAAAGLVLLLLVGGRTCRIARPGRLRRGQQLAGRVHAMA